MYRWMRPCCIVCGYPNSRDYPCLCEQIDPIQSVCRTRDFLIAPDVVGQASFDRRVTHSL
jgi:hypothetical protein